MMGLDLTGVDYHLLIYVVIAYFLGNISPAIIIGRLNGVDIREEGSGNAGTTNVLRVLGPTAALATLAIDVLKGYVAVRIGLNSGDIGAMLCFIAVVYGHIFPVVFKFRGGKGVATSLGAALAVDWLSAFALVVIAVAVAGISRKMSLGSICAAIAYPFLILYYYPSVLPMAIFMAATVVFMHRANIRRLILHEEPSISFSSKKSTPVPEGPAPVKVMPETLPDRNEVNEGSFESDIIENIVDDETVTSGRVPEAPPEDKPADAVKTTYEDKSSESEELSEAEESAKTGDAAPVEPKGAENPVNYFEAASIPEMKAAERARIAVIGDGSLAAALANRLVYQGHHVTLYIPDREVADAVRESGIYREVLPSVVLSDQLHYTANIRTAAGRKELVIFAGCGDKLPDAVRNAMRGMSLSTIAVVADTEPIHLDEDIRKAFRRNPVVTMEISEGEGAVARYENVTARISSDSAEAADRVRELLTDDRFFTEKAE